MHENQPVIIWMTAFLSKSVRKLFPVIGLISVIVLLLLSLSVASVFPASSASSSKASITVTIGAVAQGHYYDSFEPYAPTGAYAGISISASGFPTDSAITVKGSSGVPSAWTSACDCSNGWANAETNSSGGFAGTSYCGFGSNNPNACDSGSGDGAATTPAAGTYTITLTAGSVSASFKITVEKGNSKLKNEAGLFSFLGSSKAIKPGGSVAVNYYECNYVTLYSGDQVLIGGCSAVYTASGKVTGKMCGSAFTIASSSTTLPWPVSNIDVTKASPNSVMYKVPSSCSSGMQKATLSIAKGSGTTALTYNFEIKVS